MKHNPKRHRGQNFLVDKNIVRKIVAAAGLTKESVVLEVGPGTGNLTEELIKRAGQVIAVEIDKDLFAHLQKRFADAPNLTLIKDDILDVDVVLLLQRVKQVIGGRLSVIGFRELQPLTSNLLPLTSYSVVANLPYNITSRFFRKFLEDESRPEKMIVMVQKEVADRMRAVPPDMNLLALSVRLFAKVKVLFPVSRTCFSPKPRVESAVVALQCHPESVEGSYARNIFRLARAGFSSKRKYCASNINREIGIPLAAIHAAFESMGLSPKVRAQEISLEQWKKLAKTMLSL